MKEYEQLAVIIYKIENGFTISIGNKLFISGDKWKVSDLVKNAIDDMERRAEKEPGEVAENADDSGN
jgi:ribosomal protein S7